MAIRSVNVKVGANVSGYMSGFRQMTATTRDFQKELAETAAKGKGDLDAVANGATAAGVAIGAAVAGVVASGANFEDAMAQVNAVSGATAEEFEALRQTALEMGSTTAFSASEAAAATEELAKAGLSAADITGGALAGSLALASAGGLGLAEASSIAAASMSQFSLEASQVNSVADTLAGAANTSNTNVSELGQALKNVGTVANQSGLSMQETVGILSAMADNALTGAEAGTALRTTLLRLTAPTDVAKQEMERLGIEVFDASGKAKSATEIISELEGGLAGMTQEQQAATLQVLFGAEAMAGANIILKEGADGIGEYIDQVSQQGAAADTAAKRLDSLKGDVTLLTSALEGLTIQSSGGATEGLRILTQTATALIGQLNAIPAPILGSITVLGALTAAGLLLMGAAIRIRGKIAEMNAQLAATGPAGTKAAGAISRVGHAAARPVAVLGGLQAASALLSATLGEQLNPQIDAAALGLERWAEKGDAAGEIARIMGDDMDMLGQSLESAADTGFTRGVASFTEGLVPALQEVDDSLAASTERIQAMDSAMAQLHGQNPQAAAEAFAMVAEEAEAQGISMERLKEIFPEYQAAIETGTQATQEQIEPIQEASGAQSVLAEQMNLTGEEAIEAADAFSELHDRVMALIDTAFAAAEAERNVEASIDAVTEAAEENGATLDRSTEAGRANEQAIEDLVSDMAALAIATAEETGSADAANEVLEEQKQRLREVLEAAGYTEGQIQEYIDVLDQVPSQIDTTVNANLNIHTTEHLNRIITEEFGGNASQVFRYGGIRAQSGLLNEAGVFGAVSPGRIMFAETGTGGEAFVPRFGRRDRSLSILDQAASWYGAQVVPEGRQFRSARPVSVAAENGRGRRFGATVVEHQEVAVHAHSDMFGYRQVMDELAYRSAS